MEKEIAQAVWAQYGALGLLSISGWLAAWVLYRDLVRTRAKFDSLQEQTLKQVNDLGNVLKDLTDSRRLEDLVRSLKD